ncbi:ring-1,2-phenylacetyl-CoA epoxidase subunit PaaD [Allopseudospirillum japonicum]|uniref:Ring-1,2-phenylacetyl-CoA epoxidase subunit PaaD n=1 Tax=Allopseudospirillum japonicum TaxID=64971 RepID=A0A1H6ST17_9GAMM|nr:1,2-phenylacetyl-CoA epoxidase subunit PaaD [Allopseudospirillum japonicum]SEI70921.1 ring-1,2-phenylacetyl-CoA epoxidase subunit PaaD [Allopseudospirillum japonicum]
MAQAHDNAPDHPVHYQVPELTDSLEASLRSADLITTDRGRTLDFHGRRPSLDEVWALLAQVADPEVPVVSVVDLGIVRELVWAKEVLQVYITPTYSGCPATELIESEIKLALMQAGIAQVSMHQRISPAWTTDWITAQGRAKLKAYGIAPPEGSASKAALFGQVQEVTCPHCNSQNTQRISDFGSTACKSLYKCNACLEPFEYFKCI